MGVYLAYAAGYPDHGKRWRWRHVHMPRTFDMPTGSPRGEFGAFGAPGVSALIDRVLTRIAYAEAFVTAPIAKVAGGVVRREFVDRFPCIVIFVETSELRRVIMIRRGNSSPTQWRSRV